MKNFNVFALTLLLVLSIFLSSCSSVNSDKKLSSKPSGKLIESTSGKTDSEKYTEPEKIPEKKIVRSNLLIAHRGFSGEYPESTAQAFNGAFKCGFDGVECDVWESKNGDFLIHHDPTIERTAGTNKYIWNITSKTRKNFPIYKGDNAERFNGSKMIIPTLSEVLNIVRKNNGYLWLHIKNYKDDKKYLLSKKGQKRIINLLKKYKLTDRTLVFGGKKYIQPFLKKGLKTGLFTAPKNKKQVKSVAVWCKKKGVKFIVFSKIKNLQSFGSGKKLSSYLKKKKLKFGVYKIDSKKSYSYLCRIGARFSMSNFNIR